MTLKKALQKQKKKEEEEGPSLSLPLLLPPPSEMESCYAAQGNPHASASRVSGLQSCTTVSSFTISALSVYFPNKPHFLASLSSASSPNYFSNGDKNLKALG